MTSSLSSSLTHLYTERKCAVPSRQTMQLIQNRLTIQLVVRNGNSCSQHTTDFCLFPCEIEFFVLVYALIPASSHFAHLSVALSKQNEIIKSIDCARFTCTRIREQIYLLLRIDCMPRLTQSILLLAHQDFGRATNDCRYFPIRLEMRWLICSRCRRPIQLNAIDLLPPP